MDKKAWWWVLGVIIVVGVVVAGFQVGGNFGKPSVDVGLEGAAVMSQQEAEVTHSYSWEFAIVGGNAATGADQTQVTLTHDGEARDLGVYDGQCAIIDDTRWTLMPGEITGVACTWAGKGQELGVFLENGSYVVKQAALPEGTTENPAPRGTFVTLFAL